MIVVRKGCNTGKYLLRKFSEIFILYYCTLSQTTSMMTSWAQVTTHQVGSVAWEATHPANPPLSIPPKPNKQPGWFHPQSTYIPRVPQRLSPRPNWDPLTPSPASECAPPPPEPKERGTPGVTKRCRLSFLTNSALLIRVQMRGEGGSCWVSANENSCAHQVHDMEPK